MAARWSAEGRNTLQSLLTNGVELNLLKEHLPNRTHNAIHREAQKYGYGLKTIGNVARLYTGKKTRNRKKRDEKTEVKPIAEEARTASTVQEPITSERTTQNFSDKSIADNLTILKTDIQQVHDETIRLFNNLNLQSITTVMLNGCSLHLTRKGGA